MTDRERFVSELDRNFSVVAPAGVGKTTAIVERVLAIAEKHPEWLPSLVVVTYTNRAADEMQQRARAKMLEAGMDATTRTAFNRAFFGTIHSFCLLLLKRYGHHLGLPARLEVVKDEEALWLEFVRQLEKAGGDERLFRHVSMLDVIEMARSLQPERIRATPNASWPKLKLDSVLAFPATGRGKDNILLGQQRIGEWQEAALSAAAEFAPLPVIDAGGTRFVETWREASAPLRQWLGEQAMAAARDVAMRYRDYRIARGFVTYDDQVAVAAQLMQHAGAGRAIRAEGYRVILDEAQDTDPVQFDVLRSVGGGAGHFSMVGDPQQSIYGRRANLQHYRQAHEELERLTFDITYRCDHAIVDTVNALAPAMLNDRDGQVQFVTLSTRPAALTGQVIRWTPAASDLQDDWSSAQRAACEARQLADWLRRTGLKNLRARDWSEVAILCPLKRWFGALRRALTQAGFTVQVQSHRDVNGDSPAYAWLTALAVVATEPGNCFEIAGVLREVFGISDQALAEFSNGDGSKFQITTDIAGEGEAPEALTLLARARREALKLPLCDGVRHLVGATALRERLTVLLDDDGRDLPAELDDLLGRAAAAEANGESLAEWADELRQGFNEERQSEAPRAGAIQVITCQKAKGLEWDAVVVPFFFREIQFHRRGYPMLVEHAGWPVRAAFSKLDLSVDEEEALKGRGRQEMQRVLYVSMTRARRTLVLADDESLFERQTNSFADLLSVREAGPNRPQWLTLGAKATPEVAPIPKTTRGSRLVTIPALNKMDRQRGLTNAGRYVRRKLPHQQAVRFTDEEPERRLEPELEATGVARDRGVRYGQWWHDMVRSVRWNDGMESWRSAFRTSLPEAPDTARAEAEWVRFERSELAAKLSDGKLVTHAEMSFLTGDLVECTEGYIDLAALDEESNTWLVVDWKTDRDVRNLVAEYREQLRAYAAALEKLTGLGVRMAIYSTVAGQLLTVH